MIQDLIPATWYCRNLNIVFTSINVTLEHIRVFINVPSTDKVSYDPVFPISCNMYWKLQHSKATK